MVASNKIKNGEVSLMMHTICDWTCAMYGLNDGWSWPAKSLCYSCWEVYITKLILEIIGWLYSIPIVGKNAQEWYGKRDRRPKNCLIESKMKIKCECDAGLELVARDRIGFRAKRHWKRYIRLKTSKRYGTYSWKYGISFLHANRLWHNSFS